MPKMSLWPGLTYKGEGRAEERGGDVKGRAREKRRGRRGSEGREKGEGKGKGHVSTSFSHFKPWARVTG